MIKLPVFKGKEEDVLSCIRSDFESEAYPFFVEIERKRIFHSPDGEYTHRMKSSSSGLNYTGILKLKGYNYKWFFSTRFKYDSIIDDKSWICYAVFFKKSIAVFISHALKRFNERALDNIEPSVGNVFFKYVLPQLEYANIGIDSNKNNTMFMRVDEGAFLSYIFLTDGNYWFKTFISEKQMFDTQIKLSDILDEIRYFEMDLDINIAYIFQPDHKERIESWRLSSEENRQRYQIVIEAIRSVIISIGDLLDDNGKELLKCIDTEYSRITV